MQVTFLKLIRIAAGYSQQQLAGRLGIHASLLCRYENDSRPIPKRLKESFVAACAPRVKWPPLVRRARQ
jgi:transcriptional regulator with XRE-family HTH domain